MTTGLIKKAEAGLDLDREDLALLNTLVGMQEAPEPEPEDKVAHPGDADVPPMVRTATKSAGYVYLRRNSDGKLREINKNQLAERLKQKLDDGSPAWLPPNAPWKGRARVPDMWCLLSIHHPGRAHMDALNLEVCAKRGKLMGNAALRRHMQRKHKDSWDAIQRAEDQQRQDVRDAQQSQMAQALSMALAERGAVPKARDVVDFSETCGVCNAVFTSTARIGAINQLKAHKRKEHGG